MQTRLEPKARETQLLTAAINLAKKIGYSKITRDGIAVEAGCSLGLVTYHLGSMPQIREAVMRRAIRDEIVEIVAQGIAQGDALTSKVSPNLRTRAAQMMMRGK